MAFALWRERPVEWIRLALIAVCVTGIAFAPLLFVFSQALRPLALLCVPLYALLALPMRQQMAAVMQAALSGEAPNPLLLCGGRYGRNLAGGMKTALCLTACALPVLGLSLWLFLQYKGVQDAFSFLRMFRSLGSDTVQGLIAFAVVYVLSVLPLAIGVAMCAGNRHAWAMGNPGALRGRRLGVAVCWLCAQATLVPFAVTLPLIPGRPVVAVASAALLLAALSLRSLVIAAYVRRLAEEKA